MQMQSIDYLKEITILRDVDLWIMVLPLFVEQNILYSFGINIEPI